MNASIDSLSVVWINMQETDGTNWEDISALLNKSKLRLQDQGASRGI